MAGKRLAGFGYREVARRLRKLGAEYKRDASGSHEIWWREQTRQTTVVPRHSGDMRAGTLKAILDDLGLTVEQFLNAKKK
jgi:predicted RNA binding protein YcfA (HicA-like mRNA interferase family)